MAGDNNEVKLEEIVLGVQDVFPNISQDRIRRVCQHYVAEKLPHPLGNAVDYFLSHPESGPLDTPGKPTTSVPIVHLSSDSDDDISILVPPPGAAQHGRAHAVPVCSNAAVDLGMPTSVLSSTGVSSSITVATSTPVRSSKGAASSVANTPTKVGVASSTVARSTPRQAQQLHLTPQTNSTVVRKSVAASTSTPTRGMDAANPNTVGIGRTSIDSAQHPEQPLLQEDLHERVEVGAALAAVATSEQLSPLFTGDATDGAMNRHYNQVGAAITRELEHRRRIQQLQQTLQQKLNQRHQGAEGPWQGLGQHQQEADLHLYAAQQLQQQLQRQRELQQQEQQQRQQQEQQRQQQQQQQ
eukprot:scpid85109/ scgid3120/ 